MSMKAHKELRYTVTLILDENTGRKMRGIANILDDLDELNFGTYDEEEVVGILKCIYGVKVDSFERTVI